MTIRQCFSCICACAVLLLWGGTAHAASVIVGLCDGQIGTDAKSKPGEGEISAACIIPADMLAPYVGMKITKLRIGLGTTEGLTNLSGWVRTSLDADNESAALIDSPVAGWNEVLLSVPVTVAEGQDYAVGYSFRQERSCKAILLAGLDEDDDFIPAFNGCWIGKNGDWENYSERDKYDGSVCVEVVIDDDRLPAKNLVAFSHEMNPVTRLGDEASAAIVFRSIGTETVEGINYTYRINDGEETVLSTSAALGQRENDTLNVCFTTTAAMLGAGNRLTVKAETEGCVAETEVRFAVYDDSDLYPHFLLLEEFSTEKCPNCKRAIETFEQMEKEGYAEKYNQITHHCGYTSDFLTVPEDKEYTWLYGNNGSYAPAAMLDRTYSEAYPTGLKMPVPVMSVGYANDWRPILEFALAAPAFVRVDPTASFNPDTRTLDVEVSIGKNDILDLICPEARLTVILTEDSVRHHAQAGYSSPDFRHRHVFRKTLSEIWGDTIVWNGDKAVMNFSYTVPEIWTDHEVVEKDAYGNELKDTCNASRLEVVAFVNEYNPFKRSSCRVFNSGKCAVEAVAGGIKTVVNRGQPSSECYYNLSGQRIAAPARGACIVVRKWPDGHTETYKMIRGRN